jgi:hypothetical protein
VCPKSAPDSGSDSRRGKGHIVVLCNPCRNTEAEPEDKQDWMIICFRGPYAGPYGLLKKAACSDRYYLFQLTNHTGMSDKTPQAVYFSSRITSS